MSAENNTVEDITTQEPARKRMGKMAWHTIAQSFEGMRWMTEKTVGLLRLFATTALFLIVIFVVWNAIQSAKTVVVKPFAVPKRMSDTHADAGRIVANIFKQELSEAEKDILKSINQNSDESTSVESSPFITGGNQRNYVQGANIKLPETGISIDDVVEFIASIFGRENITGSVYEDNGRLFLQVELKGRMFIRAQDLPDTSGKSLNLELLGSMLHDIRNEILSVASEEYNLYFYCTEDVEGVEYKNGEFQPWFDYCTKLRNRDINPEKIRQLQSDLGHLNPSTTNGNAALSNHILTLIKGKVQQKADLLCLDGKVPTGSTGCPPEMVASKMVAVAPVAAIAPAPAPVPIPPEAEDAVIEIPAAASSNGVDSRLPGSLDGISTRSLQAQVERLAAQCRDMLTSADNINTMQSVIQQSVATASVSPQDVRLSNQLENDARTLLLNKFYDKSADKYQEAISLNCRNFNAWANLGYLYSRPDNPGRDLQQSQQALSIATQLNNTKGWIWNSLCEAEAYANTGNMEESLANHSCQQARALDPGNAVLYDKVLYTSIADEYMRRGKYQQATDAYQKAMAVDKKRDCRMQGVLAQLAILETTHKVTGAKQAACAIIKDAYLPAEESECAAQLDAFAAGC